MSALSIGEGADTRGQYQAHIQTLVFCTSPGYFTLLSLFVWSHKFELLFRISSVHVIVWQCGQGGDRYTRLLIGMRALGSGVLGLWGF